jgi:hypothetical protein
MYVTPIIPEACRLPSQVKKQLVKLENKRHDRLRQTAIKAMQLLAKDRKVADSPAAIASKSALSETEKIQQSNPLEMSHYELFVASATFNCHERIFDILHITPPKFWLQRGVRKHYDYLRTDDALIERDGGFHALDKKEVERACIERGIGVLNRKEDAIRKALAAWFRNGKQ